MLFLSESTIDRRQRLWGDFKSDKITDEVFFRTVLELDPNDFIGLVGTAKLRWVTDDLSGAEEYYWRAIQANPCVSEPYLDLARLLYREPESRAVAMGLCALGILKKSREEDDAEFLKSLNYEKAGFEGEQIEEFMELPAPLRGQLIAGSMARARTDEPEPVTERLRPLRLIEQMQQGSLDAETVDEIIAEGSAMVPLFVGVARAWAQDFLGEDGDCDLENALALVGEIGSPSEISILLEFVDLENETASGVSAWALGRIVERHPAESAKFVESIAAGLGMEARLKIAEQTLHYVEFDPAGKLLERLSENLEAMPRDDRDAFFPLLLLTMAIARRRAGVTLGRGVLRRQGSLLSRSTRRECEDLLAACEESGIPPEPPVSARVTVYEICAGEAIWDDDDESEAERGDEYLLPPEPVRRKATPGRNDPCWCNSGKKYKKCHLDSDERESRQVPGEESLAFRKLSE